MPQSPESRSKPQAMTANGLMTAAQAATLKRLAQDAYELDAFKPNLTRTEADIRIAMLTAKLKLLGSRRIHSETGPCLRVECDDTIRISARWPGSTESVSYAMSVLGH